MQFYKICGSYVTTEEMEEDRRARRELFRKIASRTTQFNEETVSECCFFAEWSDGWMSVGVLTEGNSEPMDLVERFMKYVGVDASVETAEEITLGGMQSLLDCAARQSLLIGSDGVAERFGLDRVCERRGRGLEFGENLTGRPIGEKEACLAAEKLFAGETLLPELARIFAGTKKCRAPGHPVHYIVEADDRDIRRSLYQLLLNALHSAHRLKNCRYSYLDFYPGVRYSKMAYEALYQISEGGTVVVRYLAGEESGEDDTASGEAEMIEHLCQVAKAHRDRVLTVFCFPRASKKVKARFYENLGTMTFVEVREDFVTGEAARAHLSSLARERHVRTDKALWAKLEEGHSYLATELQEKFSEWYGQKLKTSVYPQYREVLAIKKEDCKQPSRGSAYDELMELIGLREAKEVIQKALKYYKMQKLYGEKGVKRSTPAMHMVFSGNPGTAKTTVARLFARIMRENGVLSVGHLVETGRGDLVGKYVGWTAQTVREKFKAAMGGVLFIDEAYSLVDDRNGSFGDEAINTIVQEMENHRSDMVVIFAGYPEKMEGFLAKNPGLRSRIAFHVPFADYDSGELCRIASLISEKSGMKLEEAAMEKMKSAFDAAKCRADFGNGRFVRNLFEQARMNQASRLFARDLDSLTTEEITTITAEDIVLPKGQPPRKNTLGFC